MKNPLFRMLMPAALLAALLALTSCADSRGSELTYATTDMTTAVVHFAVSDSEPSGGSDATTERDGSKMTYVTTDYQTVLVHYGTSGEPSTIETPAPVETVEPSETYPDKNGDMRAIAADGAEAYVAEVTVYYWDDSTLYLMGADGEVMSVKYDDGFPFMFYTAVMSEAQPLDLRTGTRVRIEYDSGTPKEIFEKQQYRKIVSLRILPNPETATTQFGVVKAVENDRLLVYLGRCDDINTIDRSACTYVSTKYVPVVQDGYGLESQISEKIEVGDYVQVFHSGVIRESAPSECTEVYSVKLLRGHSMAQFTVSEIRSSDLILTNEKHVMRLGFGSTAFENGQPVELDTLRVGDVLEIEWDGTVYTSFPGQFGLIYVIRIVSRSTDS